METLHQRRAQAIAAINKVAKQRGIPEGRFKEGDQVWLEASNLKLPYHTPKLAPRHQGPFHVNKVVSPVAYQLALPLSWGIHDVFHVSLLLPYRETAAHGPNFAQPPPDLINDEEEYEVESIVNHRHYGRQRQLQYLIKWKGYPSSDNTWEPKENVHTEDLVKGYHRRHPLDSDKRTTRTGTKKLICALLTPTPSLSPADKIRAWLLGGTPQKPLLRTRVALPLTSKYSPSLPTFLWPSMPSDSFRKGSRERAQGTPGSLCNSLPSSCGLMFTTDGMKGPGPVVVPPRGALKKMIR